MYKHTKTGRMATIPVTIDGEQKKKFYGLCIQHDTTMTEVLRKCVDRYITEHKPRYVQVG